jgi:hypothetical protein
MFFGWSWTYPLIWFAIRTYQMNDSASDVVSLGGMINRAAMWINIGINLAIALGLAYAATKFSEYLEEKFP